MEEQQYGVAPRRTFETPLGEFQAIFLDRKEKRGGRNGIHGGQLIGVGPVTIDGRAWTINARFWVIRTSDTVSIDSVPGRPVESDPWPTDKEWAKAQREVLKAVRPTLETELASSTLYAQIQEYNRLTRIEQLHESIAYHEREIVRNQEGIESDRAELAKLEV